MATKRIRKENRVRKKTHKWFVVRYMGLPLAATGVPKRAYFTYELGTYLPSKYKKVSRHVTYEEAQKVCVALRLL